MGIINSLYRLISKNLSGAKAPLASDVNQLIDMLNGALDAGALTLAPQIATLSTAGITAAAQAGSGLGIGLYQYNFTYVTGNLQGDGTTTIAGETPGSTAISVTTTTGNQSVKISGLPAVGSWPASAIGIRIYRTAVGGASGTQKLVTTIYTNYARSTSLTSYTDSTADGSLGANVPSSNTTGTSLAGINALSHAGALTALMHYESSLLTTRGVAGTFTRASVANDPTTLANVASGTPRYSAGKYGKGVYIEEGTTNLVEYSDFETFTATTTVFFDPLTSGTAWTSQGGSFTYAAGGATCGANSSNITAGNSVWKPLTGSGGQNLALTVQATFTTPTTLSTGSNGAIDLWQDANNKYNVSFSNNTLYLQKQVGGTWTALTQIAFTPATSHTYTITLLLDHTGALTAKLYDGTGTGGTLLQTLTATDTSLTGGFLIGVGGDTGVVISNAGVIAPWADGWTIGGDQRVAWALTASNPISGNYSVSAEGVAGVQSYIVSNNFNYTSTTYTLSAYLSTNNVGPNGAYIRSSTNVGASSGIVNGTNTKTRIQVQNTASASGTNNAALLYMTDTGTVVFDAIQLEQKGYVTSYERNDSASSSATRAAETLTYPATLLNASAGTISVWAYEDGSLTTNQFILDTANASGRFFLQKYNGNYRVFFNDSLLISQSIVTAGIHHYAVSWSGTSVSFYIDGVKVNSASSASAISFSGVTNLHIGSAFDGTSQKNGTIDELAIFNRALTDAEVYSIYAATQPVIDVFGSDAATVNGQTPVDASTNQTIGGSKTFSSPPTVSVNLPEVYLDRPSGQTGQYGGLETTDNNVSKGRLFWDYTNNKWVLSPDAGSHYYDVRNGNDSYVLASTNSTAAIAASTWTKIPLTAEIDANGEWDGTTNYRFTAKQAGFYQVNAYVTVTNLATNTALNIYTYKNGVAGKILGSSPTGGQAQGSQSLKLNAGDYVELYVYAYGTCNFGGSTSNTWMDITRIP